MLELIQRFREWLLVRSAQKKIAQDRNALRLTEDEWNAAWARAVRKYERERRYRNNTQESNND